MAPWLVVCGWSGCGFQVRSVHGDGVAEGVEDADGNTKARLLDLVPGRSGKAYSDWLEERGEDFRDGIEVATLDPFHGYKNAIDDQLEDATAVLDAFHMVKLGTTPWTRSGAGSSSPRRRRTAQTCPSAGPAPGGSRPTMPRQHR